MWVQYPQGVQKRYLQNDRSTEHSGHVLQLTDLHALLLDEEYLAHLWQHTSPESLTISAISPDLFEFRNCNPSRHCE